MHAASVNPEPGSNSLKNCILNPAKAELNIFFRAIYLSFFFYFLSFFFFQSVLTRSLHFSVLEISCCSIFNDRCGLKYALAFRRLTIIPDITLIVNRFFNIFYNFFHFGKNSNKNRTNRYHLSKLHTKEAKCQTRRARV